MRTNISNITSTNSYIQAKPFPKQFFGKAPAPFIGRAGYPNIYAGMLATNNPLEDLDNPTEWTKKNLTQEHIKILRSSLVNSRFKTTVHSKSKFSENIEDVAMASKAVDMEILLSKAPKASLVSDPYSPPRGPAADLVKSTITENPKISNHIQKAFDDTDLKATEAINSLYKKGISEHKLSQVLSVGAFGVKASRKLVPTRWSITATDDTLGKNLHQQLIDYQSINDYEIYYDTYFDNNYILLLLPGVWSFELFETTDGKKFAQDFEYSGGRTNYATSCTGGYYTVRLAALEHLLARKRQANVLAIRIIGPNYPTSLGVWVTRQATRKALLRQITTYTTYQEAKDAVERICKLKFKLNPSNMINESKILDLQKQSSLQSFF